MVNVLQFQIHFVHRKRDLNENGILQSDSYVVLGVFMGSGNDKKAFKPFEKAVQKVVSEAGQ